MVDREKTAGWWIFGLMLFSAIAGIGLILSRMYEMRVFEMWSSMNAVYIFIQLLTYIFWVLIRANTILIGVFSLPKYSEKRKRIIGPLIVSGLTHLSSGVVSFAVLFWTTWVNRSFPAIFSTCFFWIVISEAFLLAVILLLVLRFRFVNIRTGILIAVLSVSAIASAVNCGIEFASLADLANSSADLVQQILRRAWDLSIPSAIAFYAALVLIILFVRPRPCVTQAQEG